MPGLKRHPSLQDLSRDHQVVLLHARAMRWSVEGHPRGQPAAVVAQEFLDFWEGEGTLHLQEEEQVLLPAYGRRMRHESLEDERAVQKMLEDHAWLHEAAAELQLCVELGEDCTQQLAALARRLHDHVRLEERVIFPRVQERLGQAQLAQLAAHSQEFRLHWRGPAACGNPISSSSGSHPAFAGETAE